MIENHGIEKVFSDVLESTRLHLSGVKPSEWYETHMVMPRGSAFPGPFSFDLTPFWREPLDCAAKDHPAKEISIMKGAQLGGTAAVLNPIVGYTIAQNPGNIMFLTGHSDLSEAAFLKIDQMIDNCGIRSLIRPNVMRKKNSRTGDTNKLKEFPGGDLKGGSVTNHNLLRQHDVMIMIVDDFDAAAMSSKHAGSTRELVQKRTSAFAHKKKILYVSSPQIMYQSNIDSVFQMGNQRYFNVPCPCCGAQIVLKWEVKIDSKEMAGITWKLDTQGNIVRGSVGYICQECAGFFTDKHKYEMNLAGQWVPTVIAKEENHWSYQISSLYSPPGMDDWAHYVQQFVNANRPGQRIDDKKNQTFYNVVLGLPYEQKGKSLEAAEIQKKIRNYEIGIVPEKLSISDGNGHILFLTCACDLNGKMEDARLDWEVVAWTESGASYSIKHGSIGTFVYREGEKKIKEDRDLWTYEHKQQNSVWPELEKILKSGFETDNGDGRKMGIAMSGVDCGHFTIQAYTFIDTVNCPVIGLRGDKENQYRKFGIDMPVFKHAKERANLYMLDVNNIKDIVSSNIDLKWVPWSGQPQPPGFMNYPTPGMGLYLPHNYFNHYEAEARKTESKDGEAMSALWQKKSSSMENHFWDIYVYNFALKEIYAYMALKNQKPPVKGTYQDFVRLFSQRIRKV